MKRVMHLTLNKRYDKLEIRGDKRAVKGMANRGKT